MTLFAGSQAPATGYRLPATGYRLPATGYRLPATGYRLPATGRWEPQRHEGRKGSSKKGGEWSSRRDAEDAEEW